MSSLSSSTNAPSFHPLIANASCLFGVVVFLQQMLGEATLEHSLLTTAGSGLAAYLILVVGYAAVAGILSNAGEEATNRAEDRKRLGTTSDEATGEEEADQKTPGAS